MRTSKLNSLAWLRTHDPGLSALRRAGRAAIVMPGMFALGSEVIDNPMVASFAAFGSFAMLLLVEFGGPMRNRLQAQAALAVVGAVFICVGTLASRSAWLAAVAMGLVGFGVLFSGVVSSVLASASLALLLAFILPVTQKAPASAIPDRLAGWGMASAAAFIAVALLWPAPARDPLRRAGVLACRELAARLRSEVAYLLEGKAGPSQAEHDEAIAKSDAAVAAVHQTFYATPYRPTGLSTPARTVVRLVDELSWLNAIIVQAAHQSDGIMANRAACAVKSRATSVLERGADLLDEFGGSADALDAALTDLHEALLALEMNTTVELPAAHGVPGSSAAEDQRIADLVTSLDPGFRAQELSFAVSQIAANIRLTAAAERRSWLERFLGHQPAGLTGPVSAAQERAAAHVERHSVSLQNSVRGAIGLGVAVLIADLSGVQHSFWVVLGTLSVLRSNALSTGQSVVQSLRGTLLGFLIGAGLILVVGTNTTVLWFLLPLAILLAGIAPTAISFAAGQAGFTLTLVILFNILQPAGWRVGLLRIEDVAIGCGVSVVVGLLFWPRGAGAALGQALSRAYIDSAHYLAAAVDFGLGCCDRGMPARPAPTDEAMRAAAAARRLDDVFRSYLSERGAKRAPLAAVTGLVTGVAGLRLAADAVLDLWRRDDSEQGGDRDAAREQLLASTGAVAGWYERFADSLAGLANVPEPTAQDQDAAHQLVDAVRRDLRDEDGNASAVAVRIIWTGDQLDAARRLESGLVGPARAVREPSSGPLGEFRELLARA
jgi:uncharacterized membrane protein YccC